MSSMDTMETIDTKQILQQKNAELQQNINIILQKYSTKQNVFISSFYLGRDIFISFLFTLFMYSIQSHIYFPLWWLLYSIGQGTIWMGLWVLGHECGHGAFSKSTMINDAFGLCIHSFLLVPYYSWQYSHKKHHKYTNHLILGETHVPSLKTKLQQSYIQNIYTFLGEDIFAFIFVCLRLFLGWNLYLLYNESGGRTDFDGNRLDKKKSVSHFNPTSQIFPPTMYSRVVISDIFIGIMMCGFICMDYMYGFGTSLQWYFGPYCIVNCWLVLYTYLHHTSEKLPHYGTDDFTWLQGALSTIDRPYPYLIDELHHHIGSTHIIHHLNYKIPFHYAKKATEEIKYLLQDKYNFDDTNIFISLFQTTKKCLYIESLEGTQYYKNK